MKTETELQAELDTLTAQREQIHAQYHMVRGYIQRVEEDLAALKAETAGDPAPDPA